MFQLTGDRCEELDKFSEGQTVGLEFNLRGREWTNPQGEVKYFNSLDVWKLDEPQAQAGFDEGAPMPDEPLEPMDDIPF